jgi:hypothetical protein
MVLATNPSFFDVASLRTNCKVVVHCGGDKFFGTQNLNQQVVGGERLAGVRFVLASLDRHDLTGECCRTFHVSVSSPCDSRLDTVSATSTALSILTTQQPSKTTLPILP